MKNKKRNETLKSQQESGALKVEHSLHGHLNAADKGPSTSAKTWLSIWVVVHLMAIAVSFTSVVQPSSLHRRLSEVLQPYLRPTHFSVDDRPVYLTYGDADDQPHRIEVTRDLLTGVATSEDLKWRVIGPAQGGGIAATPGLAVSDRVARWLSTAAMLAENDQPSLVADLVLPVVANQPAIQGVRIVRYPTDLNDINSGVTVPYVARVVRDQGRVSLVQLKESRLSAQPRVSVVRPGRAQTVWPVGKQPGETRDALAGPLAAYHSQASHLYGAEVPNE
ncbi:MAG TPA: hypothetical protein DEF45_11090 [Rhodopirellula sp.]|nr:hypothetical protein [Rhodopirellula sp.]